MKVLQSRAINNRLRCESRGTMVLHREEVTTAPSLPDPLLFPSLVALSINYFNFFVLAFTPVQLCDV